MVYEHFRFGVFEQAKLYMVNENGSLSNSGKLLCGLAAGVAEAIFAVTPMETVKVKFINDMRMEKPRFKGFFHGVRTIVREEGKTNKFRIYSAYTILCIDDYDKTGTNLARSLHIPFSYAFFIYSIHTNAQRTLLKKVLCYNTYYK